MYIYPNDLRQKATMWFWTLPDLVIIIAGILVSVLALFKLKFFVPLVATALYTFLSIRLDGACVKDFIAYASRYFVLEQQHYKWIAEEQPDE